MLSDTLGIDVWLKADHLQPTGTFKIRGATNKIRTLTDAERARGVITASTGNHGRGAARAGEVGRAADCTTATHAPLVCSFLPEPNITEQIHLSEHISTAN